MNKVITADTLYQQLPSHILEQYPNFVQFLKAYYEWVSREDGPYDKIKNHMDYLDFQKSIDAYITAMKDEYLSDVPDSVLLDKELFIKWSKKFNLSRGSQESYKFLFSILFDEQDTEIYLPKDNILRTSDGVWVDNESRLILTNSGTLNEFRFARISQKKEVLPGFFEYAYANVQTVRNRYSGGYNVLELTVSDVEGDFVRDFPIVSSTGAEEWLIETAHDFTVNEFCEQCAPGSRVDFENDISYVIERDLTSTRFDTRVTSYFTDSQITVEVNGTPITDFSYDGRYIDSPLMSIGDTIKVSLPSYKGYMIFNGSDIEVLETPIGLSSDEALKIEAPYATIFDVIAHPGASSPIPGYYEDNRGHLSSTMYLQDSFYYQEYSYAIRTKQNIDSYASTVKDLLHPSGFAMFGYLRIVDILEILIGLESSEYEILPWEMESRAKYTLGPNYSFLDRFKHGLSGRLYNLSHFRDKNENDYVIYMDPAFIEDQDDYVESYKPLYYYQFELIQAIGEEGYNLEDSSLGRTLISGQGGFMEYDFIKELYYYADGRWVVKRKGWMTKQSLSDYFLYVPQDYTHETESGNNYFETGYVSERE